jgi:hypothetical protein
MLTLALWMMENVLGMPQDVKTIDYVEVNTWA